MSGAMATGEPSPIRAAGASVRRALRSPRAIVAELLAIALAGVALAAIPQLELPRDLPRLRAEHPVLAPLANALGLDRVLHGPWLWVPLVAAIGSLGLVLVEQWPRAVRLLRVRPDAGSFARAPYRRELVRQARGATTRLRRHHALGHLGSPVFHSGLALVVVAGLLRALAGRDAVVDLVEGEVLPPVAEAFGAQWGGPLSRPLALPAPLRLLKIDREQHPTGALRALSASAAFVEPGGVERAARVAINDPLDAPGVRLYLTNRNGIAVLVGAGEGGSPTALLLEEGELAGRYEARSFVGDGNELLVRASAGPGGALPAALDVRVLRRGALAFAGTVGAGSAISVPGGGSIAFGEPRRWARFEATADPSVPFALSGFTLAVLGAVLLVGLVPYDTAVVVAAAPEGERVTVALRPHRLAVIFEDRFERLVREEEGGSPSP